MIFKFTRYWIINIDFASYKSGEICGEIKNSPIDKFTTNLNLAVLNFKHQKIDLSFTSNNLTPTTF